MQRVRFAEAKPSQVFQIREDEGGWYKEKRFQVTFGFSSFPCRHARHESRHSHSSDITQACIPPLSCEFGRLHTFVKFDTHGAKPAFLSDLSLACSDCSSQ